MKKTLLLLCMLFTIGLNAQITDCSELFISEYIEPSGGNNKALEIVNLTSAIVDMSAYSIKKQSNGSGDWIHEFVLSGIINVNEVMVIINYQADNSILVSEADIIGPSTNFGSPINFNGNDPVGLFKDDILIDIVGEFGGGSSNFAKDKTLRRKSTVVEPNINFDLDTEWEIFPMDTFDDIGGTHLTLSTEEDQWKQLSVYPNPTSDGFLNIKFNFPIKSGLL